MSSVAPSDNTVAYIRMKVRRLTACASESTLPTALIDQYINTVYNNDFPYAIKMEQTRSVYTFFTQPYIDKYPIDVNFNQSIRAPLYVDGIQGAFFKDRQQFYNLWPRFPTFFNKAGANASGRIVYVNRSNPARVKSYNHGLDTGDIVYIEGVLGMTQINGGPYTITVVDANRFTLDGIDSLAYTQYESGGEWTSVNAFEISVPGPILRNEVTIGGNDSNGNAFSITDDGYGNLNYVEPNPVVTVPPYTDVYNAGNDPTPSPGNSLVGYPIPGMHNQNTRNPGLKKLTTIGTVDYVTGLMELDLPNGLEPGTLFKGWVVQYVTGRPYSMLYWNNELTIRPVPDVIHKVEIETYLTPVQFMNSTDSPILNQWAQYIAYLAAQEILRDRQDMAGVQALEEGRMRQEALLLERQSCEEIFTPNVQLWTSSQTTYVNGGLGQGFGGGFW